MEERQEIQQLREELEQVYLRSLEEFRPVDADDFRRRYRLQRNRPLGGTYATPSMGETSVYTLRKWETGQIT